MLRDLTIILAIITSASSRAGVPIRNADDLLLTIDKHIPGKRFEIRAQVIDALPEYKTMFLALVGSNVFHFCDMRRRPASALKRGDIAILSGQTDWSKDHSHVNPNCDSTTLITHSELPSAEKINIRDIPRLGNISRRISVNGILTDIFQDDIDSTFTFLLVKNGNDSIYAACANIDPAISRCIGSPVNITGITTENMRCGRRFSLEILLVSQPSDIMAINHTTKDRFTAPSFDFSKKWLAAEIAHLGLRKVTGTVLARRANGHILIQSPNDETIEVECIDGSYPNIGTNIEAVGAPETDLFSLILTRATWKAITNTSLPFKPPATCTIADMFTGYKGKSIIDMHNHGRLIRTQGEIRLIQSNKIGPQRLLIEDGGNKLYIDCSTISQSLTGLREGSVVEITGIGALDSDIWRPNAIFPKVRGLDLVPRLPTDIRLVRAAPFWNSQRFAIALIILTASIIAIIIWNISLHALVERKSQEVICERSREIKSKLRITERTRLAIDLHDSLAQDLTGVALAIDTACNAQGAEQEKRLKMAARALKSCRSTLRNCLWDLRSSALEEPDMNAAISRTLQPHVSDTNVSINFEIPRQHFSDKTAHAILSTIRELTVNAIRHGKATRIQITGNHTQTGFQINVIDNGCGFDTHHYPGFEQGHFGIQGIYERVTALNGFLDIKSTIGEGTRASITFITKNPNLSQETNTHHT